MSEKEILQRLEEELIKKATAVNGAEFVNSKKLILDNREAYLRQYEEKLLKKEN